MSIILCPNIECKNTSFHGAEKNKPFDAKTRLKGSVCGESMIFMKLDPIELRFLNGLQLFALKFAIENRLILKLNGNVFYFEDRKKK